MQFMGDAVWWDKRFAARPQQLLPPLAAMVLPDYLTPGGTLFLNGFCALPPGNSAMTQADLICAADYVFLEKGCTSLLRQEYETELGKFLTVIYQKK